MLAVTSGEPKASILDELQNYPDYVLIREKSQQLAGEKAVLNSVISRCQVDKHDTGFLVSLKRVLDILREPNDLVHG